MTVAVVCESRRDDYENGWRRDLKLRARLAGLCTVCPVLVSCRDLALSEPVDGFVAGMTPHERRTARRVAS